MCACWYVDAVAAVNPFIRRIPVKLRERYLMESLVELQKLKAPSADGGTVACSYRLMIAHLRRPSYWRDWTFDEAKRRPFFTISFIYILPSYISYPVVEYPICSYVDIVARARIYLSLYPIYILVDQFSVPPNTKKCLCIFLPIWFQYRNHITNCNLYTVGPKWHRYTFMNRL